MDPRLFLKLAPERRLMMTFALRQALEILQMPQQELAEWLLQEIEKNPLLEFSAQRPKRAFEGEIPTPPNLYESLQSQIREHFPDEAGRKMAEGLLEGLDERGFFCESIDLSVDQRRILGVLQTFDPPGIFARNLQEALLLQLRAQGKKGSLAYTLVEHCYPDLLHGRYAAIKKRLGLSDFSGAIGDLARLSLRPAQGFQREVTKPVYPDLQIRKIEEGWTLELIEEEIPPFHIQTQYLDLEAQTEEESEALRTFKTQAKWILRSLNRRRKMLREIGRALIRKQATFLDRKGPLVPLSLRELAGKLGIHESTLSRALAGKYVSTPRGIFPLRFLVEADPGAKNAREVLQILIEGEDKAHPLTDDQLAKEMSLKGFPVARRTVAKYRVQLKIGPAARRKHCSAS